MANVISGKPPQVIRTVRAMRGGSQAKLILCDDDRQYVVKFTNNPQRTRTLVNEIVASEILTALRLPVPRWQPILLTDEYLRDNPLTLHFGSALVPVQSGLHFGSTFCGHNCAVYDWLPSLFLQSTRMMEDFLGIYVADQWMANRDMRQAVFHRNGSRQWCVKFIDHGHAFGGACWDFKNSFGWGAYHDRSVYRRVGALDDAQYWIARIRDLDEDVFALAQRAVPPEWIAGDFDVLEMLIDDLIGRRRYLTGIIERTIRHPLSPFAGSDTTKHVSRFYGLLDVSRR